MNNTKAKKQVNLDECIIKVASGSMDALKELYEEMKGPIYLFALSIIKNSEEAKDIMQDTFLKIKANAQCYRPKSNPKAWIFKIVRNLAIDVLKSRRQIFDIEDYKQFADQDSFEDKIADKSEVLELLSRLKPNEQEIVNLYIYGGLTHLEISKVLSLPYEMIRWKYSYSLKKLKKHLTKNNLILRKDVVYESEGN